MNKNYQYKTGDLYQYNYNKNKIILILKCLEYDTKTSYQFKSIIYEFHSYNHFIMNEYISYCDTKINE
jgi:hypothetical protein